MKIESVVTESERAKSEEKLLVKDGRVFIKLAHSAILWLEADDNYTIIHVANDKNRVVRTSLRELQKQLPLQQFIQIHKSYIVNCIHINEWTSTYVIITEQKLPISRSYSKRVKELL